RPTTAEPGREVRPRPADTSHARHGRKHVRRRLCSPRHQLRCVSKRKADLCFHALEVRPYQLAPVRFGLHRYVECRRLPYDQLPREPRSRIPSFSRLQDRPFWFPENSTLDSHVCPYIYAPAIRRYPADPPEPLKLSRLMVGVVLLLSFISSSRSLQPPLVLLTSHQSALAFLPQRFNTYFFSDRPIHCRNYKSVAAVHRNGPP